MFAARMKQRVFSRRGLWLILQAVFLFMMAPARAQVQAGAGVNMMNSAFLKLFENFTNFSCKADFHMLDAIQKEIGVTPLTMTILGSDLRMDVDFAEVKGPDIPPEMVPSLKRLGMDESTIIMLPDHTNVISIYPHAHAFTEKQMSTNEVAATHLIYTLEKTKLGRENIEGHPCQKYTVVMTDNKGAKHTATVWYATDLKGFPIQIRMTELDSTLIMRFRDIKFNAADPSRFAAPPGFTRFKSDEALMNAAIKANPPK